MKILLAEETNQVTNTPQNERTKKMFFSTNQSGGSENYPNLSMSIDTFNRTAPHEQNHVCLSKPSDENSQAIHHMQRRSAVVF